jgi:hypothetical protein
MKYEDYAYYHARINRKTNVTQPAFNQQLILRKSYFIPISQVGFEHNADLQKSAFLTRIKMRLLTRIYANQIGFTLLQKNLRTALASPAINPQKGIIDMAFTISMEK